MSIAKVDFGRIDAESDSKLGDYFVDTGVLRRIKTGERQVIIGRKGSGKTALFQQAERGITGTHIIRMEFSDYAWESHKAIIELGLPAENAYSASWLFTFLMAACQAWRKSTDKSISRPADEIYQKIFGSEEAGILSFLIDKVRRLRKLELPNAGNFGGLGSFELENQTGGSTLAKAANAWNQKLLELSTILHHKAPVTILVDRLDDGWDASPEIRNMLAGALKAARSINLKFGRPTMPRPVIIFLRSDIFAELKFNDKNKMSGDIENLEWKDEALLDIVKERIAKSLGVGREEAWEMAFSPKPMRQRASIASYLLKRTMQRPRDIIAFCNQCRSAAVDAENNVVETSDVYAAERVYSRHIYDELVDEMHKQFPDYAQMFRGLQLIGYMRFRREDWVKAVRQIDTGATQGEAERMLKVLFAFGVVGVPKVGGRGGGSTFEFVYQDRYLDPRFDGDLVVHPALRKQLDLKDAGAGSATTDDEPKAEDIAPHPGHPDKPLN